MRPRRLDRLFARFRRRGDARALAEVFDATAPELYRVATHLTRDLHAAEDLVQSTFLAAIEARESWDESRGVLPWLIGIVARQAALERRRRARTLDVERLEPRLAPEPGQVVEARELSEELTRAIDRLPALYRDVLVAHLRHGKSPQEIASDLGRAPGTVRVQLHRGIELLRKALPIGLGTGGLLSASSPQGLSAVRAVVVRSAMRACGPAAAAVGVPSAAVVLGGVAMSTKVVVGVVGVAVVLALVGRVALRSSDPIAPNAGDASLQPQATDRAPTEARSPTPVGTERVAVQPATPRAAPVTAPAAKNERGEITLDAKFVRPDLMLLVLEEATLTLRADGGVERRVAIVHSSNAVVTGLAPGRYSAVVTAPGFDCPEDILDLTGPGGSTTINERIVLWPAGWVPVVARTSDGRPFSALAGDFNMEPKRLFVDAFEVRTRTGPPGSDAWESKDPEPAVFRKPPGNQNWELPGGAIGSLELVQPPPMWVGLALFGLPVGWERVVPGAREVVFQLDISMFEQRFARLRLQVVDAASGEAVKDARATLLADTSAHRRQEHHDVAPGDDGVVEFTRIVPGRYEVTVTRENALYQVRFELAAAEKRDLGRIALTRGALIELRVEDAHGQPVRAWLEVGTYQRGARVKDLYPPMISRTTDPNGVGRLPTPASASIVRATMVELDRATEVRSGNVLVDPAHLSGAPLRLVVRQPSDVSVEVGDPKIASIEFQDALDLVVGSISPKGGIWPSTRLTPGDYVVRCMGADGRSLGEQRVTVGESPVHVRVP